MNRLEADYLEEEKNILQRGVSRQCARLKLIIKIQKYTKNIVWSTHEYCEYIFRTDYAMFEKKK